MVVSSMDFYVFFRGIRVFRGSLLSPDSALEKNQQKRKDYYHGKHGMHEKTTKSLFLFRVAPCFPW